MLFKYAQYESHDISLPSLKVLGNISQGNKKQMQILIDNNFLMLAENVLESSSKA